MDEDGAGIRRIVKKGDDGLTITPHPIESTSQVPEPAIALRSYLSRELLDASRHLATMTGQAEAELSLARQKHFAVATFLTLVAYADSTINELLQDAWENLRANWQIDEPRRLRLAALWPTLRGERCGIEDKYKRAVKAVDGDMDWGKGPSQDFGLVVRIRNSLVHFVPETQSVVRLSKLSNQVQQKRFQNPMLGPGNPPFPGQVLSAQGANWAVDTTSSFVDEALSQLGASRFA